MWDESTEVEGGAKGEFDMQLFTRLACEACFVLGDIEERPTKQAHSSGRRVNP